ncbi:MAG: 2,3-bisphosphoglycerate-independent phosphoglycerate mutase [Gammaproteobacteria bacterium]
MNSSGVPRCPTLLVILDGFGVNATVENNAVAQARTPKLDRWFADFPHTTVEASGAAVGLPEGQMGNSEVGHMTLGSGTVIRQDLVLINDAIEDCSFHENPAINAAITKARDMGRPVHLFGLVSDGGVHSHLDHLVALLELCRMRGVHALVHMVTDGRDTPPRSAMDWVPELNEALKTSDSAVATVMGRFWGMDRDHRWERTEKAWRALVLNEGRAAASVEEAIESAYALGQNDEFIEPVILPDAIPLVDGDQLISFNFRKDRPRQTVEALFKPGFEAFERPRTPDLTVTCMMEYHPSYGLPVAFRADKPDTALNRILAARDIGQFHCAETEKYPHVTYYFNGGQHDKVAGEVHDLIPSPKVETYDLMPEMSAPEVADHVVAALQSGTYGFVVVNFANGDMVGHTGDMEAAVKAVEVLDREVGRVLDAARAQGFAVLLTADHGNCDEMVDPRTGGPHTQHSLFPVPCLVIDDVHWALADGGGLADIAPTVLELMGIEQPASMQGRSLLIPPTAVESAA